jgi:catechol 2,3-dioxygenase-like lactoylglutathione lyase family enzyme
MSKLTGVIETALYVADMERAVKFYKTLFELETLAFDDRFHALSVADQQVLLLFRQGGSLSHTPLPGGIIPPHDGSGPVHVGFSIPSDSIQEWESRLADHGIAVEGKVLWPRGGTSLYFRDPDGHLLEVLTPGVWRVF